MVAQTVQRRQSGSIERNDRPRAIDPNGWRIRLGKRREREST